jgi:hypothetical protein
VFSPGASSYSASMNEYFPVTDAPSRSTTRLFSKTPAPFRARGYDAPVPGSAPALACPSAAAARRASSGKPRLSRSYPAWPSGSASLASPEFPPFTFPPCSPDPHHLAVLARPGFVRAAPAVPGTTRIRLPSATPACCGRPAAKVSHLHSNQQRLAAHSMAMRNWPLTARGRAVAEVLFTFGRKGRTWTVRPSGGWSRLYRGCLSPGTRWPRQRPRAWSSCPRSRTAAVMSWTTCGGVCGSIQSRMS